jgi:endoglucanase
MTGGNCVTMRLRNRAILENRLAMRLSRLISAARKLVGLLCFAVLAFGCAEFTEWGPPAYAESFKPIDAGTGNAKIGRGVNVLADDPGWFVPSQARFFPSDFAIIRAAGFNSIRLELKAFLHIDDEGRFQPEYLRRTDTMLQAASAAGLVVIVDEADFTTCGRSATICRTKLNAFWTQIAHRYKDAPNTVVFEILNEPNGAITPLLWNAQLRETLAIIRKENPTRNVIIGPAEWNSFMGLSELSLPADDRHIIVTVHYYAPQAFTHQGAAWSRSTKDLRDIVWGSDQDVAQVKSDLDLVKRWSIEHDRPIFLGEFGTYDIAPMPSRIKYASVVARAAEARGFSWAYHQFDQTFHIYDVEKRQWLEPLLHALIPESKQ